MAMRDRVPAPLHGAARGVYGLLSAVSGPLRALPDFIVIGGQRCGTTSLFKNLAEHPQVFRPGIEKGVDYYTLHYDRGLHWYRSNFPMRSVARLRYRGPGQPQVFEACTYYMFHPFALERLARDLPDVKLIAMLRDPVERAFSAYKHEFARGFETEPDFERALALEDERLEGEFEKIASDVTYESHAHRHHAYKLRGQYVEQIERALRHFPADNIHVCESESYFREPENEYRKITDFLGLTPFLPKVFDRHNARPSSPMPGNTRAILEAHFAPYDERLAELLQRQPRWVTESRRLR